MAGDTYKNEGVAGNMGPGAHDNTFVQDARMSHSTGKLSPQDAEVIERLAKRLTATEVQGLSLVERMDGARYLAVLAASAKSGAPDERSVEGWRKWLGKLGPRSSAVIATLADLVTIGTPIAKMLGFSV